MSVSMADAGLSQRKLELRQRMTELRDGIDGMTRMDLGDVVASRLAELPAFWHAGAIGIYYATGSEVQTQRLILRMVEEEGRTAFLPFHLSGALQMTEWRPSDPVVVAPYVGFQPRFARAVPLEQIEVMVVPGLAFDVQGNRLGCGDGLYDRLLARMAPGTVRIGIAYHVQLVDSVPAGPEDAGVDVVVTEDGILQCEQPVAW